MAGNGPAILLLHGIGMTHGTWRHVLPRLAKDFTVIAPDLLGHGESDKPRADYSIGGYANGMRDLLTILDIPRVTVVGHSLGGGIAMQFGYQFPHLAERVVLVGSGGLGRTVNPLIRALTVPGAGPMVAAAATPAIRSVAIPLLQRLHRTGLPLTQDLQGLAEVYDSLGDRRSRAAFRHVLRAAVDWRGQVVTMIDRAYLARHMPCLVVWGGKDMVIPVRHAFAAHELLPGSRLHVFMDAGHLPHEDQPGRFADCVADFILDTPASRHDPQMWRDVLLEGQSVPKWRQSGNVRLPEQSGSAEEEPSVNLGIASRAGRV